MDATLCLRQPISLRSVVGALTLFSEREAHRLNEVPRLTFQEVYSDPEDVAAKASLSNPVQLVQNDGILVVARSVFECFDRLEVAEATAQ